MRYTRKAPSWLGFAAPRKQPGAKPDGEAKASIEM
jgi:hypothetical protein